MIKRFLMVLFTLIVALVTILIAARHPTGPNTVSYDEPLGLWLSIGMVIILFLPILILALINNRMSNIIIIIFQALAAITFLALIPVGFIFRESIGVSIIAFLGMLLSLASVVTTVKNRLKTRSKKLILYGMGR